MAKKSMMARQKKKLAQARRRLDKRDALRATIRNGSDDDRAEALFRLHRSPRNDSMTRVRRRCNSCGRPRGVYRKFGLCRICLREVMMKHGFVPGLRKASW